MILVVVYVGAVAVLFLFVVMMLDVDFAELRQGFLQYLPVGALIGVVVGFELVLRRPSGWRRSLDRGRVAADPPGRSPTPRALGRVLYTKYIYFFQAAGMDPAGRDDRRDRADACATSRRQAPGHLRPGRAHAGDARSKSQGPLARRHLGDTP